MNDRLKAELDEEFDKLNALSPSDEGYKEATERFTKVYSLYLDEEKNQTEAEFKKLQIQNDELMKKAQLSETKKDRWWKVGLGVAGLVLPLAIQTVWYKMGMKFEETGSFSSACSRSIFGNLFKNKTK